MHKAASLRWDRDSCTNVRLCVKVKGRKVGSYRSYPVTNPSSVKTVLVDNQKAAVLKNNNGKVVFNSGFLLLADHYDFLPRACRPRRARTKGKLERMVKYLKENFFVRYRRFDSFAHVNQQLEQWMADVVDKRELRQFKQTPEQRFALELGHLQQLPDTDFDTSLNRPPAPNAPLSRQNPR